ncbi:interferon lambda receptor 1 [Trichomycterus rosablanca]|uniref:interferon lambda receptor 1 n=1 Tax=Trichomycterus rosablanca TaxID=2290929 RepID=UPI002F356797
MFSLKVFLLFFCSSGFRCRGCDRTRVYFESRNFYSVLRWDEVELPGQDVRYSVTYHEYGNNSQPHLECQNISEPSCDLSSVMTNIHMRYFAKVLVGGVCFGQYVGFVPFEKTVLGAPDVTVTAAESSLGVTLAPPVGPQNRSMSEITCWESCPRDSRPSIVYIVHFTQPEFQSGRVYKNTSGVITVNHVKKGAMYCGVAMYQLAHPVAKRLSENATFCLTLPGMTWIRLVLGVSAAVALVVLGGVGLVMCQQYVTRKRNLPKALIISKTRSPNFSPAPKVQISDLTVSTEPPLNKDMDTPVLRKAAALTQGSYAAQDCRAQDWRDHSYTNQHVAPIKPGDRTSDSCTSYSMVVGVMVPQDPEEFDSGLGRSLSPGADSSPGDAFQDLGDARSELERSVLPVSRGADGRLEFSSLVFQPLLPGVSPTTPPVTASTPASETAPLLTDLLFRDDSGCAEQDLGPDYTRAYLPNRVPCFKPAPVGVATDLSSNYRQNWVPGILPDPPLKVPEHPQEPEEGVEGSAQSFGGMFLDGWAVEIHS